jgi:hypothetical protein
MTYMNINECISNFAALKTLALQDSLPQTSCLHRASIVSKTLFIVPTDARYYENHRMLKQFKIITLALTCFGSHRNHHQWAVLCLAKTTKYGFSALVGTDAVNVVVAYQLVVQVCGLREPKHLGASVIILNCFNIL